MFTQRIVQFIRRFVRIPCGRVFLDGDLVVPPQARGLVLFVHGSSSSRNSPRNQFVAEELNRQKLGTLLFDLLTPTEELVEERTEHLRFDVPLLAERVIQAIDYVKRDSMLSHLPLGLFGASTGAAAALVAATQRPVDIAAVVSRGGRPDLAGRFLPLVLPPTMLIVGGNDHTVIDLNEMAVARLRHVKDLRVVPGAGHLFVEPGALEQVASLAGRWFARHLARSTRFNRNSEMSRAVAYA
jgi:pimeloyl-ACP methyl ester carboxylesterase